MRLNVINYADDYVTVLTYIDVTTHTLDSHSHYPTINTTMIYSADIENTFPHFPKTELRKLDKLELTKSYKILLLDVIFTTFVQFF